MRFADHLRETAMPLGMKNLRVEVEIMPADMNSTGIDSLRFMVAFNKNQPLMPVGDTASGGEISRLMLSIKTIIASRMSLPSIIFDEIDTGVDSCQPYGTDDARDLKVNPSDNHYTSTSSSREG